MERLVHVVPLGWERDRAVEPLLDAKCHRVYLLMRTDSPWDRHFSKLVRAGLADQVSTDEIRLVHLDHNREFESVLMHTASLIVKEHELGNRVYVNISAAGKISAAAATLCGMYHSDRVGGLYYAKPERYAVGGAHTLETFKMHGLSVGYAGTLDLPRFGMVRPKPNGARALQILYERGPQTLTELMANLKAAGVEPFHEFPTARPAAKADRVTHDRDLLAWAARLRRTILQPLAAWRLINQSERGADGKIRLRLTKDGAYYALIGGHVTTLRPPAGL